MVKLARRKKFMKTKNKFYSNIKTQDRLNKNGGISSVDSCRQLYLQNISTDIMQLITCKVFQIFLYSFSVIL